MCFLGSSGLHFRTPGDHCGVILESRGPFGTPGGRFSDGVGFWSILRTKASPPEHRNDWYLPMQSREKAEKRSVRNVAFKTSAPGLTRNSQMCDPYSKYHMFRRVQGSRLERVLSSFGVALGVPWALFLSKVAPWRI